MFQWEIPGGFPPAFLLLRFNASIKNVFTRPRPPDDREIARRQSCLLTAMLFNVLIVRHSDFAFGIYNASTDELFRL
jgi:hypothetical protein